MGKESLTISRRGFLKFAGKTAAVSAGVPLRLCQTSMQPAGKTAGGSARAIDIHHHYIPLELIDEVKRNGKALGASNTFRRRPPKTIRSRSNFPKAIGSTPDPRMAEVNESPRRHDQRQRWHRHGGSAHRLRGLRARRQPRRNLVEYLQRRDHESGKAPSRPLRRHCDRAAARPAARG